MKLVSMLIEQAKHIQNISFSKKNEIHVNNKKFFSNYAQNWYDE